jgi:hypothetical protein
MADMATTNELSFQVSMLRLAVALNPSASETFRYVDQQAKRFSELADPSYVRQPGGAGNGPRADSSRPPSSSSSSSDHGLPTN